MWSLVAPLADVVVIQFDDRFYGLVSGLGYIALGISVVMGFSAIICCLICCFRRRHVN